MIIPVYSHHGMLDNSVLSSISSLRLACADYLPPNPAWGSGCDLEAAMWRAKDRGHLMMPYSNPTWWDPVSPTLSHLPAGTTLADVTTLNASGQTTWENYADTSDCCRCVCVG